RQMIERRRDEAGDPALHVDSTAAIQTIAGKCAGERRGRPGALVPGRHDVGGPGGPEDRAGRAEGRIEIVDRRGPRLGKNRPMRVKSGSRQEILQISERAAFVRRDRAAADEIASDGNRVGWHSYSMRSNGIRPVLVGADRASTKA